MLQYLRARLAEKVTWVGLGASLGGSVSALGSYLSSVEVHWMVRVAIACGVVAAVVPTSRREKC